MNAYYFGCGQQFMEVEYAVSGRSTCKVCRQKILKDELRISNSLDNDNFSGKFWHHLQCFKVKPKHLKIKPEKQIYGIRLLEPDDLQKVLKYWKEGQKKYQADVVQIKVEDTDKEPKNKGKKKQIKEKKLPQGAYTTAQRKKFYQYCDQYEKKPAQQLKEILKKNGQPKTGTKAQLIERCADGKLLGRIPLCFECGGGKLRFNATNGTYKCPGYMQDDQFKHCNKVSLFADIKRAKWIQ